MTSRDPALDPADGCTVAAQIGRPPRGAWTVVSRCPHDMPRVIRVASRLEDGTPFPTTFWLTCPWLVERVGALESDGMHARMGARVPTDPALEQWALAADAAYRAARAADGEDPCTGTGVAGQAEPLVVKCLHARVAAALAGMGDPFGEEALAAACIDADACAERRCAPVPKRAGSILDAY